MKISFGYYQKEKLLVFSRKLRMKDALINIEPNRLEDIIALVALYRPGPMTIFQFIMIVNMVERS